MDEEGSEKPRSARIARESAKVFITVRKMMTLSGSPWYTTICNGMGYVSQSCEDIVADKPEYHDCKRAQNSRGAW